MTLLTLPAVLVQSLMHALQPREILSLARCCKWTLQCANSAFAWRDCPPLYLMLDSKAAGSLLARSSRLSRWIPLSLDSDGMCLREADATCVLQLMQSCSRIIQLYWPEWNLTVERGVELLSHPSLQSARDLGLSSGMRAAWLAAAAQLPSLTQLNLVDSGLAAADLQPLVHARALRLLAVSEANGECLSAVIRLTQLTTLYIYTPRINGGNFVAFCAAMSGLEELCLLEWQSADIRSISAADLSAGFSSLRCLRTLKFFISVDAQTLAPSLHHAPSLRCLRMPEFESDDVAMILAQLMRVAPLLQIVCERRVDQDALEIATRLSVPIPQEPSIKEPRAC